MSHVWDGLKGPDMAEIDALIGPSIAISPRITEKSRKVRPDEPEKLNGRIHMFNEARGFGFIRTEDGEEYFVHRSALPEGADVRRGVRVSFELERNIRTGRTSAINARIIR